MGSEDFLFTWKADKWPYAKLRELIERFEAGQVVVERWRCQSHRRAGPGSRAYFYKQGASPRGIFGIGEIVGPAEPRDDPKPGEQLYMAPVRFEVLLDPTERFILSEEELLGLSAPRHRWAAQASGVALEAEVARLIDRRAVSEGLTRVPIVTPASHERYERLQEVYARDRTLVIELKGLYAGACQICGSVPFDGKLGSVAEAHHIHWLSRGGRDELSNLILLCPNHHAAVHSADPEFDWAILQFHFGPIQIPLVLNRHLKVA